MIYICIPTHNEQQTVGVVLWKLRQVLTDFPREYQLLVADDASTDKTQEVLEPYTRVLPLTVIRSDVRQGTAASLEMLLREAVRRSEYPKRDVIVTLQADFSEEPDDLVPLAKRLEAGADVAVGNKVSVSKETRARRFARSLAGFFMRRQKWPEGVVTPFEGFRAYRLYAIKRAIEERSGSRLLRYDGWAGNAELLRAVLPHARRVDVVDVDDRPDRLQRPRREKPFASAMQVRVMAAGTEPAGLTGVEELDRIARTASRSRERAAITPQSIQAGRSGQARGNGSRQRAGQSQRREGASQGRDQGRTRTQANGTRTGSEPSGGSRSGRTRQAPADHTPPSGERTRKTGTAPGRSRSRQDEAKRRQPKPTAADADVAAGAEEPIVPVDATEGVQATDGAPRPKRKRRRRKRGGQGGAAAGQQDPASQSAESPGNAESSQGSESARPAQSSQAGADVADDGSPEEPGANGAAEKKRRRRGGRRGGRGRRKPRPDGAGENAEAAGGAPSESPATAPAAGAQAADPPGGAAADRKGAETRGESSASAAPVARAEND